MRVVPTYSGGYFTQDTVPSVKIGERSSHQYVFRFVNLSGAIPSHGEAILTLDIRTSKLVHSRGSRISIHQEVYAEHVGTGLELTLRSVTTLHRSCAGECGGAIPSLTRLIVQRLYRKRNSPARNSPGCIVEGALQLITMFHLAGSGVIHAGDMYGASSLD